MSHNDMSIAEKNLHQAAEVETSSAWTVARLIAASVAGKQGSRSDLVSQDMKFGVNEAAAMMGRSNKTITAYLNAWNAAAADGLCTPSSDLTPEDGWTAAMPDAADWEKYKQANSHSTPRQTQTVPAEPIKAVEQWTPEQKQEIVRHLVSKDEGAAAVAQEVVRRQPAPLPHVERSERHEDFTQASRRAQKARAAEDSKATSIDKWLRATEYIGDAERHEITVGRIVQEAIDFLSTRNFKGEANDLLTDAVTELRDRMQANLDRVEALNALLSEGATDWDAALAQLTGGDL